MSHLMTAVVLERLHAGRSLLGKHNLQLSQEVSRLLISCFLALFHKFAR